MNISVTWQQDYNSVSLQETCPLYTCFRTTRLLPNLTDRIDPTTLSKNELVYVILHSEFTFLGHGNIFHRCLNFVDENLRHS